MFDLEDALDFLKIVAVGCMVVVVVITIIFTPILGVTVLSEVKTCSQYEALMPNETFQWVLWGGCLYELPDGTWTHASTYLNMGRFQLEVEQ